MKLLILFFGTARRKEPKEEPPSAHLPLKTTHIFGSAARRALRALCGAPLFPKNAPKFFNAPKMRSESSRQHRFARCFPLCILYFPLYNYLQSHPTSLEQREEISSVFTLKVPHRKEREAHVLRRLVKWEKS